MRLKHLWLLASASMFGLLIGACLPATALAQALTGQVASSEEGSMEGVLVSAKKEGSTITVTVVTDAQGRYSFPADRLPPGRYAVSLRAVGYDLDGPKAVDVAAGGSKADLKLVKTKNLANQLSNGEWLMSAPGPDDLKGHMTNCVSCHTLQRVFSSMHTAEEFKQIFRRMGSYSPGSTPSHPQVLLPGPRGDRSPMPQSQFEAESAWLASVDLSTTGTWTYEFQTLPRPKGVSTKVIYTEYDLPRKETQPHDVIVDQDGMVWYSDFSNQFAGVLDPKTGKATDIPIPVLKPEQPKGSLEIELEPGQKHVWLAMMYQAGIAQIDRATHEVKAYGFPTEWQSTSAQASMVWVASSGIRFASNMVYSHDGHCRLCNDRGAAIQIHNGFIPIAGEYNTAAGERFASWTDKTGIRCPRCRWSEIMNTYNNSHRTGVHSDREHRVFLGGIGTIEPDRNLRADVSSRIADVHCVSKLNGNTRTVIRRTGVPFRNQRINRSYQQNNGITNRA
jgi:Carboxypeptidase regulatory-like domain